MRREIIHTWNEGSRTKVKPGNLNPVHDHRNKHPSTTPPITSKHNNSLPIIQPVQFTSFPDLAAYDTASQARIFEYVKKTFYPASMNEDTAAALGNAFFNLLLTVPEIHAKAGKWEYERPERELIKAQLGLYSRVVSSLEVSQRDIISGLGNFAKKEKFKWQGIDQLLEYSLRTESQYDIVLVSQGYDVIRELKGKKTKELELLLEPIETKYGNTINNLAEELETITEPKNIYKQAKDYFEGKEDPMKDFPTSVERMEELEEMHVMIKYLSETGLHPEYGAILKKLFDATISLVSEAMQLKSTFKQELILPIYSRITNNGIAIVDSGKDLVLPGMKEIAIYGNAKLYQKIKE
jgi:hypothetical protein